MLRQFKIALKQWLPRSLFGRSLLIIVVPLFILQCFTVYMFFDRHWTKMTARLANALAGEIAIISKKIEEQPEIIDDITTKAAEHLDMILTLQPPPLKTAGETHDYVSRTLASAIDVQVRRPYTLRLLEERKLMRIWIELDTNQVLYISVPTRRLSSSSGYIFLLWTIASSLLLFAIALLFLRNQIRPIKRLAIAADRFGKGRDMEHFKVEGSREVRQAGEAFVRMRERLHRQIAQRTEMLAGVSHDLRTPLTRMELQLAVMGDSPDVAALRSDIKAMEAMLEGYLAFARGEGDEESRLINIAHFMDTLISDEKRHGTEITYNSDVDGTILMREQAMRRALSNIISNARKYGDQIAVTTTQKNGYLVIEIADNGPGIDEKDYENVFKPFVRLDHSRNADSGGVGLGMPIAMDVIHTHGGRIWLSRSSELGGLQVNIKVPL